MSVLRWFAREGFRTLKYVFRGIFRSLLRYVPCTMHPPLFSHPLRVNGMAGVSLAPMPPGIALKTAAARYAPLRLHLADRAGLNIPVSTCPLTAVLAVSPGCAPAFPPVFLTRLNPRRTTRLLFNSDIIAEGSSSDSSKSMEHRDMQQGVGPAKNR